MYFLEYCVSVLTFLHIMKGGRVILYIVSVKSKRQAKKSKNDSPYSSHLLVSNNLFACSIKTNYE